MARDKNLLLGVSDYFTEDTLKSIFAKNNNVNEKDVQILSWDFGDASKKGDSYLSTVNRIHVTGTTKGKPAEIKLVVKSLPKNMARRKTYRSTEFFYNEIIFYTEVLPKFNDFLASKGQSSLLCVPRCMASYLDGENDFIALEDVSIHGFGPLVRQNCLSFEHLQRMLETMARFHATSFAHRDQRRAEFENMSSKLQETYYREDLWESWYKEFATNTLNRIAKDALAKEYPGSKGEKKFNSYKQVDFFNMSTDFCNRTSAPTSVINQGDSWPPNFLARESSGKLEILILDFQLARCCSPVLDMSFLIYACSDKDLLDKHFDDFLKIYYDELARTITLLGSNPNKIYPWDTYMKEVKEQFGHGLIFSLEAIPFAMLSEDESFDLDELVKDEKMNIADIWTVPNIKTSEGRKRLANVILHAVDRGFL